jgi:hypothetical protein
MKSGLCPCGVTNRNPIASPIARAEPLMNISEFWDGQLKKEAGSQQSSADGFPLTSRNYTTGTTGCALFDGCRRPPVPCLACHLKRNCIYPQHALTIAVRMQRGREICEVQANYPFLVYIDIAYLGYQTQDFSLDSLRSSPFAEYIENCFICLIGNHLDPTVLLDDFGDFLLYFSRIMSCPARKTPCSQFPSLTNHPRCSLT